MSTNAEDAVAVEAPISAPAHKPLNIGPLEVWPPVVLAPMAGVTDVPFRTLCRGFGAGIYVNQMLTARAICERHARTLKLAEFAADESPRSVQLYGVDPYWTAEATKWLVNEHGVDHIDMNFGCPVKKVTKCGGGGALPVKRNHLRAIIAATVKAAGDIPVTIKFRMGVDDDNLTYLDAGKIGEEEGVKAVALHARTVEQLYSGYADRSAIAALAEHVTTIPVLGNGDIWEAHDAVEMMAETGCDGVVIGRGCLGRPWLFRDLVDIFEGRPVQPPPTMADVVPVIRRHAHLLVEWTESELSLRSFRKHAVWYLTGFPVGPKIRRRLNMVTSLDELDDVLGDIDPSLQLPLEAMRIPRSHTGGPKPVTLPEGWLDDPYGPAVMGKEAEAIVSGG